MNINTRNDVIIAGDVYKAPGGAAPNGKNGVVATATSIHVQRGRNDWCELVPDAVVSPVGVAASVSLRLLHAWRSGIHRFRCGTGGVLHVAEGIRIDVGGVGKIVVGWRRSGDLESYRLRLASTGRGIQDGDVVGAAKGAEQSSGKGGC